MPAFTHRESGGFADTAVGHGSQAILEVAERLFAAEPDWIVFFREIMGLDGIVRRTYQTPDSLMRFECSAEYARIREMLDALRQNAHVTSRNTQGRGSGYEREHQQTLYFEIAQITG